LRYDDVILNLGDIWYAISSNYCESKIIKIV